MRLGGERTGKTDYCLCDNNYFILVICGGKARIMLLSLLLLLPSLCFQPQTRLSTASASLRGPNSLTFSIFFSSSRTVFLVVATSHRLRLQVECELHCFGVDACFIYSECERHSNITDLEGMMLFHFMPATFYEATLGKMSQSLYVPQFLLFYVRTLIYRR